MLAKPVINRVASISYAICVYIKLIGVALIWTIVFGVNNSIIIKILTSVSYAIIIYVFLINVFNGNTVIIFIGDTIIIKISVIVWVEFFFR